MFLNRRSSIGGLYFAGAWVGSGGFQATLASGRSTARSLLKDMTR
jgi:predicted NAD/FAD-dependent oxidoreductase